MLQARLACRLAAIDSLVQSVNVWEFNWSAWRLLDRLIDGIDEVCISQTSSSPRLTLNPAS